jgi:hypothetical protein
LIDYLKEKKYSFLATLLNALLLGGDFEWQSLAFELFVANALALKKL